MTVAISNDVDPLCKLVMDDTYNQNQYYRLCVVVSRSSYFKHELPYPDGWPIHSCEVKELSFRTTAALGEASGMSYYERMTHCTFRDATGESYLYISRAYLSSQLFVYLLDPADGKLYLENLSTNISIVDELNSYDFIED